MTREHAKELAPIIAAYGEGKTIEVSHNGEWMAIVNPQFDIEPRAYRIKPEPRKVWINEYSDGRFGFPHSTKEEADTARSVDASRTLIACHELELPPAEP